MLKLLKPFLPLVALLGLLTGCSEKTPPASRPPAPVVTADAAQKDIPVLLRAIGNVEGSEVVAVKPQINGELTEVNFREGQDVKKGDVLFRIDARPYMAALRKAEAALARDRVIMENARANYGRYRQLVKEGIITMEQAEGYRTSAESAEATVAADRAEVENARAQLSYCTIKAPISGRLGVLAVHRGNVVKANEVVLVTINKISPVKVLFSVPEKHLADLKQLMSKGRVTVEAAIDKTGGTTEKGLLDFMDNTVDAATGTIKMKGIFDNAARRLWPGQLVNVSITMGIIKNAVIVPSQALQTGQQGQYLFVVKTDSTAELRNVKTGPSEQGITVIEQGLQSGEKVVIDGQVRIIPGSKVEVKTGLGTRDSGPVKDIKSGSGVQEAGSASNSGSRVTGPESR